MGELMVVIKPFKTLINIKRSNNRLKCIRKNIGIIMTTCDRFPSRKLDSMCKSEILCHECKISSTNKCRTNICELPFWFEWKIMIQFFCNSKFENSISEILYSLVRLSIPNICLIEYTSVDTCKEESEEKRGELLPFLQTPIYHNEEILEA